MSGSASVSGMAPARRAAAAPGRAEAAAAGRREQRLASGGPEDRPPPQERRPALAGDRRGGRTARPATLLLVTGVFPNDPIREVSFVAPELGHLTRAFDRVIVAPAEGGAAPNVQAPDGIEVEHSLARAVHPQSALERGGLAARSLTDPLVHAELWRHPQLCVHSVMLRRVMYCCVAARRAAAWLERRLARGELDPGSTLVYTFWLNHLTAAAGLVRRRFPELRVVSRAHGADVFVERYRPPVLPLHRRAAAAADRVFPASTAARQSLAEQYPWLEQRLTVAPLGSPDPGFQATSSRDGAFRLVSCAALRPGKRIHLLVDGLAAAASSRPDLELAWHHLGGGQLEESVRRRAAERLPANVRWSLSGPLTPDQVMEFYRSRPVDLMVSVSDSEGGRPLAIAEAMSCGVPVLATAVGGVPEIVDASCGWLLPSDPDPAEIGRALVAAAEDPSLAARRQAARAVWRRDHDADRHRTVFAAGLRALLDGRPAAAP